MSWSVRDATSGCITGFTPCAGLEQVQLAGDVDRALAGQARPSGFDAVAVRAMAGGAQGSLGRRRRRPCRGQTGAPRALQARPGAAPLQQRSQALRLVALPGRRHARARAGGGCGEGGGSPAKRLSGSAALLAFPASLLRCEGAELYTTAMTLAFRAARSMSRFNQVQFLISAAAPAQFPADFGAEVAFVGRSNAGKSSAINAITQRHGLGAHQQDPRAHPAAQLLRARAARSAWSTCPDTATPTCRRNSAAPGRR